MSIGSEIGELEYKYNFKSSIDMISTAFNYHGTNKFIVKCIRRYWKVF